MKLFVACPVCRRRIDIAANARTRADLPEVFIVECPNEGCAAQGQPVFCNSGSVLAEQGHAGAVGGSVAGSAVGGLIAGPLGLGIGLLVGLMLGASADGDAAAVQVFNNS
jgi:hypothetical protein